jgi:hypothetical protein
MGTIGYGYGSEWHLTLWLARRRSALTHQIEQRLGLSGVQWLDYEEYRDRTGHQALRERRGLDFLPANEPARHEWEESWPQKGGVHSWDAVGHATAGTTTTWILVEAKAHVGELISSCGAVADQSRRRIAEILSHARGSLGAPDSSDWMKDHYQYCNRLALLQFLRERGVDARLVFVYFTGDRVELGAAGRDCPSDEDTWRPALDRQKRSVGLPTSALILSFVYELFLPVYRTPLLTDRNAVNQISQ